ncbi:MAG: hypothetical protein AAFR26_19700 [Cyanobacteria bacterium J06626_4]
MPQPSGLRRGRERSPPMMNHQLCLLQANSFGWVQRDGIGSKN